SLVSMIYIISSLSFLVMAGVNAVKTEQVVSGLSGISSGAEADTDGLPITLSSGGKNVVVIMLDRGISGYIPFIINEKPELKEQFDGFTYYPNTISFGTSTNFGAPALFGGYEYSVDEINKRKDESLVSKHNEALKVMPVIFSSHGFKTTVGNMPWVNYTYVTDFSIYEDYPDIRTVDINGNVNRTDHSLNYPEQEKTRRRDFFMYSVFKIMPLAFQGEVYNRGDYRAAEMPPFFSSQKFLNAYNVLSEFPGLTEVMNNDENTFFVIDNDTAHEPCELQLPEYEPVPAPDNEGLETESRTDGEGNVLEMDEQYHYHTNMAAMLLLGKWLDLLKEKGVYDNTRIVIAADHGEGLGQFDYFMYDEDTDMEYVNPLLMYKDFGARGFSISDDFMTNADTPTLAMQGLIDNPVNPFTGKVIDNKEKTAHNQLVSMSLNWDILKNNGNVFDTSDAEWFEVHDDIFNKNNWKVIEYPSLSGQNRSLTP
ncbi:MAG: sulfatase-like hydrolase/transferase, partial [Lachnospiraceae bacterium]|nr:sulfatase-like hydrolase/transferase [Lachnospiraceae bacterium]